MNFKRLEIKDVVLCEPEVFEDERGYFFESFRADRLSEFLGVAVSFSQDNESKSNKGVLRGFHYQLPPFAQSKFVRVIAGDVLDVVLDIRKGSPTFGKHLKIKLSADNKKQVFIPKGFAHAFLVLEDNTVFSYKVDAPYAPNYDRGLLYNDPDLEIDWGMSEEKLVLSDKDTKHPTLKESTELFCYKDFSYV